MPAFNKKGYAYEATSALLGKLLQEGDIHTIHAVKMPGNNSSVRLIEKTGLLFDREIIVNNEVLHIYTAESSGLLSSVAI